MSDEAEKKRTPTPGCTCFRLRKASRAVSQIYDHFLEPHGLTITQYGLLAQLVQHDGISIGALAEKLIMDPTTLTRNLRPLERDGLVLFASDPEDRRTRRLQLTEKGRATHKTARPAWIEAELHIDEMLGETEAPALNAALDHLLKRLST
ncbi:MAG: MarR family winged helix-turn-helix transcriptional regulator [Rhodomicrobiaceae bacterium]